MNNFDTIIISEETENVLVVMKTSEPPFDYLTEIEASLWERHDVGTVMIVELLHSGNTEVRFIHGYFDGNQFDSGRFAFEYVPKKSKLREPICFYLFQDRESLEYSILTSRQQKLIENGCII